jgi:two-component system LytT family response regulator
VWLGAATERRFLVPADIVRLAAADDYSEVFLTDGGSLLHPEPLQRLLKQLPVSFLRTHRSHAINLSHLRSFRKGHRSSVLLSDNSIAPVSRRRVSMLLAQLNG